MNIVDLLIIYLSIGAPFGAHAYISARKGPMRISAINAVIGTFVWPVTAFRWRVARKTFDAVANSIGQFREKTRDESEAESIRIEMEAAVNMSGAALADFREVFQRYVGLSQAPAGDDEASFAAHAELLAAAGLDRNFIAERCIERRNAQRLSYHLDRARHDLFASIGNTADGSLNECTFRLLRLTGDPLGEEQFKELIRAGRISAVRVVSSLSADEILQPELSESPMVAVTMDRPWKDAAN